MPAPGGRVPFYKKPLLVSGCVLILFGVGNWTTGTLQTAPHLEYLKRHPGPRTAPNDLKSGLLLPPDEQREERDVARAKLEFYQLVQGGGRVMMLVGSLCLLGEWMRKRAAFLRL